MRGISQFILLPFLAFVASGCALRNAPNQDGSKLREVERIWESMPVYPSAVEAGDAYISSNPTSALMGRAYRSPASYAELRRFYVERLGREGWQLIEERRMYDWGEDLGGQKLSFRKGEYSIQLQLAGEKAGYGWDYTINAGWEY